MEMFFADDVPCTIQKMCINAASMILGLASCLISMSLSGCNLYPMSWRCFRPKQCSMIYALYRHETECQQSSNDFSSCILGNRGSGQIQLLITELMTPFLTKIGLFKWRNTDSKIHDIAHCKRLNKKLFSAESTILIKCYYQTATTRAIYKFTYGLAGQLADNPPILDVLGDFQ
jgi:hypothetical protein